MSLSNGHSPTVPPLLRTALVTEADLRDVISLALKHLDAKPYEPGDRHRYAAVTRLLEQIGREDTQS